MNADDEWWFELHLRGSVPPHAERQQERTADHLREQVGEVELERRVWPKRVPLDGETDAVERYREFEAWADRRGVSLSPFFRVRESYSSDTGERYDALVLPVLCLAAWRDDELVTVYPHVEDGTVRTVADALAALDEGRLDADAGATEGGVAD